MSLGGISARRFIKLFFSLFGLGLLVSGCSSIPGYPKPLSIDQVDTQPKPTKMTKTTTTVTGAANSKITETTTTETTELSSPLSAVELLSCGTRECRDREVFKLIAESDMKFDEFKKALYKEGVSIGLAGDTFRLGLEAAATVAGGSGTKSALSAAAAGIGSFQGAIDKRVFFEQTLTAIIQLMNAKRTEVLKTIYEGLAKSIERYPPGAALHDIRVLHASGSVPEALAEVVAEARKAATTAQAELEKAQKTLDELSITGGPPPEDIQKQRAALIKFLDESGQMSIEELRVYGAIVGLGNTSNMEKRLILANLSMTIKPVITLEKMAPYLEPFKNEFKDKDNFRDLYFSQVFYTIDLENYTKKKAIEAGDKKLDPSVIEAMASCWGVSMENSAGDTKSVGEIRNEINKKTFESTRDQLTRCQQQLENTS